jgi:hypothetical protein
MNLTIYNLSSEQLASIQQQIAGGGTPNPPPSGDFDFAALKAAPSNWAAYTFCNDQEWAALDAKYGSQAVNEVKNYYRGPQAMYGLLTPGDPNTVLREYPATLPIRYYYFANPGNVQTEDTGQADAVQEKLSGKKQPTLPIRP